MNCSCSGLAKVSDRIQSQNKQRERPTRALSVTEADHSAGVCGRKANATEPHLVYG